MLNTIEINRVFKSQIEADKMALRAATLLSLAVAAIVPIPAAPMETSANYQGYFLENASALTSIIDEIREIHLLNSDDVLRNAYGIWSARFRMYQNTDALYILNGGNVYNQALDAMVPQGMKLSDLDINVPALDAVIDFVRKNCAMGTNAAVTGE